MNAIRYAPTPLEATRAVVTLDTECLLTTKSAWVSYVYIKCLSTDLHTNSIHVCSMLLLPAYEHALSVHMQEYYFCFSFYTSVVVPTFDNLCTQLYSQSSHNRQAYGTHMQYSQSSHNRQAYGTHMQYSQSSHNRQAYGTHMQYTLLRGLVRAMTLWGSLADEVTLINIPEFKLLNLLYRRVVRLIGELTVHILLLNYVQLIPKLFHLTLIGARRN